MIYRSLRRRLESLRFPKLFALFATLLVLDLAIPDPIPVIDELLLAVGTVMLASLRNRKPKPVAAAKENAGPAL